MFGILVMESLDEVSIIKCYEIVVQQEMFE